MFCVKCGKEIPNDSKVCMYCGAKLIKDNTSSIQTLEKQPKKKKWKIVLVIAFVIVLVILCGAIFWGGNEDSTSGKITSDKTQAPASLEETDGFEVWKENDSDDTEMLTLPVTVVNNTGVDIYSLYASVVETMDWEEDILDEDILFAGEEVVIDFTFGEDQLRWDFAMTDVEDNMIEFYDLDFSECSVDGATLVLEYDGENGYATLE